MESLVLFAVIPVLLLYFYGHVTRMMQNRLPKLLNKRICLLIAHPDDESMFFAPTLLAITRPETRNHVQILCLSTGNSQGLGHIRKKELFKSCSMLGVKQEDVFVVNNSKFRDSKLCTWDKDEISDLLCEPFIQEAIDESCYEIQNTSTSFDVLITFDQHGVSSHPNHTSLYHGARTYVSHLKHKKPSLESGVDLYTLTSVSLIRKYIGFVDAFVTWPLWLANAKQHRNKATTLLFFNHLTGNNGLPAAWRTMTTAHKSQMEWFRWGWIAFSRYMVINDLKLEQI